MSDKGRDPEIEDAIIIEETVNPGPIEFKYLIDTVLDYYASSGNQTLTEGDEWKKGTEHMPQGIEVPEEVDAEVRKAFVHQIKKFQK